MHLGVPHANESTLLYLLMAMRLDVFASSKSTWCRLYIAIRQRFNPGIGLAGNCMKSDLGNTQERSQKGCMQLTDNEEAKLGWRKLRKGTKRCRKECTWWRREAASAEVWSPSLNQQLT